MKRSISGIAALALLAATGGLLSACSGTASDTANANTEQHGATTASFSSADEALAEGNRLLDTGETEKAIEVLNQAVTLNPDLAEAYFRLGIAYSLIEFRDQTVADESTTPTPTPLPGEKKPKEKKTNSEIAFEKAVDAYKKQISANKEDHLANYNLGRAYAKLNEDEDAAKALRRAADLKPEDTEYQTELASILIRLAKYHEAVGSLKKALELDPDNIEAEELLEKAEAGRKRVSFTQLPTDDKKSSNSNTDAEPSGNSNSQSNTAKPKPTETKPPKPPAPPANRPKS